MIRIVCSIFEEWIVVDSPLDFDVFLVGRPAPQGSKRYVGARRLVEVSPHVKAWREAMVMQLNWQYKYGHPMAPPYRVCVEFIQGKPRKPTYQWPVQGDLDKLVRAVGDALQQAGVIVDDKHITCWKASKRFQGNCQTGVRVVVNAAWECGGHAED